MITQYTDAAGQALGGLLELLMRLALPLGICAGLGVIALAVAFRPNEANGWWLGGRTALRGLGYAAVAVLGLAGWAALSTVRPLARQDIQWRESAQATANPVPDAPAVYQFSPAVAALVERTYTRTLTLPPDCVQRLGEGGLGVLSPYLTDPSSENVLRLVDTFRRSGRDVLFTRGVTRLDEEPIAIDRSQVRVKFRRLTGRAYELDFEGRYAFRNPRPEPITARFQLALPEAGTIRDLDVRVGDQPVTEPNEGNGYEWQSRLSPGEKREAVVRYRVLGAGSWHYDLGSRRRRVQEFHLEAVPGGPVRFARGSLEPTRSAGGTLQWELSNVVTAQQIALSFPPDVAGRDSYLQALSAFPLSLLVFGIGVLGLGWLTRVVPTPAALAGAVLVFILGLGAAAILANYVGSVAAVILAPLGGAGAAAGVLGRRSLVAALPAALLPAAFLSPTHSGLLILVLAVLTGVAFSVLIRPSGLRFGAPAGDASPAYS